MYAMEQNNRLTKPPGHLLAELISQAVLPRDSREDTTSIKVDLGRLTSFGATQKVDCGCKRR